VDCERSWRTANGTGLYNIAMTRQGRMRSTNHHHHHLKACSYIVMEIDGPSAGSPTLWYSASYWLVQLPGASRAFIGSLPSGWHVVATQSKLSMRLAWDREEVVLYVVISCDCYGRISSVANLALPPYKSLCTLPSQYNWPRFHQFYLKPLCLYAEKFREHCCILSHISPSFLHHSNSSGRDRGPY